MSFEKRILLSPFWSVNIIAVWREPSGLSGLSGLFGLSSSFSWSDSDAQKTSVLGPQSSALSADQHDVLNFWRRSPRFPAMRSGVAIFTGLTSGVFSLL